jgi:CDP-4-dehydro-6-deoxyglucose reductase, E3
MSNFRNVSVRGRSFRVRAGDILLDGALANGVEIPHDCRAGTCGTCMVQVVKGQTVFRRARTARRLPRMAASADASFASM